MKERLWRIEFDMGADKVVYYRRCTVENLDKEIEKIKPEGCKCTTFQVVDEKLLESVTKLVGNGKAKKYVIQDRQAGNVIDEFDSLESAENALKLYEMDDKNNGDYEPDFYEIIQEG